MVNTKKKPTQLAPFTITGMGGRIKELRLAHEMTQEELADLCGVSKAAVSYWEAGETKNIRLVTFRALLEALHTKYDYLIFGPK